MMKDELNRLVEKPAPEVALDAAQTPRAIRAMTGLEQKKVGDVASEEVTTQSSDGLFTFIVRVVKA